MGKIKESHHRPRAAGSRPERVPSPPAAGPTGALPLLPAAVPGCPEDGNRCPGLGGRAAPRPPCRCCPGPVRPHPLSTHARPAPTAHPAPPPGAAGARSLPGAVLLHRLPAPGGPPSELSGHCGAGRRSGPPGPRTLSGAAARPPPWRARRRTWLPRPGALVVPCPPPTVRRGGGRFAVQSQSSGAALSAGPEVVRLTGRLPAGDASRRRPPGPGRNPCGRTAAVVSPPDTRECCPRPPLRGAGRVPPCRTAAGAGGRQLPADRVPVSWSSRRPAPGAPLHSRSHTATAEHGPPPLGRPGRPTKTRSPAPPQPKSPHQNESCTAPPPQPARPHAAPTTTRPSARGHRRPPPRTSSARPRAAAPLVGSTTALEPTRPSRCSPGRTVPRQAAAGCSGRRPDSAPKAGHRPAPLVHYAVGRPPPGPHGTAGPPTGSCRCPPPWCRYRPPAVCPTPPRSDPPADGRAGPVAALPPRGGRPRTGDAPGAACHRAPGRTRVRPAGPGRAGPPCCPARLRRECGAPANRPPPTRRSCPRPAAAPPGRRTDDRWP